FDNYNLDAQGHRDAVRTSTFNLSNSAHAQLSFDVAYAMNSAPFYDTLVVYISYNCDQNRDIIYLKDASALQTAPASPNVTFVPTPSEWRNELISLDAYIGQPNISIIFENRGYAGQELYIDNVSLVEPLGTVSGRKYNSINVYPNPSESDFTLSFSDFQNQKLRLEVYSSSGVQVLSKNCFISKATEILPLEMNKFGKGIYFLHIKNEAGKTVYQQKLTHL
ncbi:MAG TPA: T9SS type A sorting domain-containing protein, partial [Bacteroidia bacterium]|nr:T9SS type A sorting domain-containing protein [Bacteroidia bacterium]